jgi:hypothetical protein
MIYTIVLVLFMLGGLTAYYRSMAKGMKGKLRLITHEENKKEATKSRKKSKSAVDKARDARKVLTLSNKSRYDN